jgi:fructoselysine-6-P-deglycase FrlB-like protein
MAGILIIWVMAMMFALLQQARMLAALETKLSIKDAEIAWVHGETEALKKDVRAKNEQLAELQNWRVIITVAARTSWGNAVRYIQETELEFPPPEVSRPGS